MTAGGCQIPKERFHCVLAMGIARKEGARLQPVKSAKEPHQEHTDSHKHWATDEHLSQQPAYYSNGNQGSRPMPLSESSQALLQLSGVPKRHGLGALAGVRTWLRVLPDGRYSVVQLERHALERKLGVQLRDFRVLDAVLGTSYPACILVRSSALVVNLEHIKCLISRDYVLLNNTEVERVKPLLDLLTERLKSSAGYAPSHSSPPTNSAGLNAGQEDSAHKKNNVQQPLIPAAVHQSSGQSYSRAGSGGGVDVGGVGVGGGVGLSALPFELTVLEACSEQLILSFDRQASDVDLRARKAIEQLVHKVSPSSLERIRQVKDRLTHLQKKVNATKDVLRKLLEDDRSMTYMNLSARHDAEQLLQLQQQRADQPQAGAAGRTSQHICTHNSHLTSSMHSHSNRMAEVGWNSLPSPYPLGGGSRQYQRQSLALGGSGDFTAELATANSAAGADQVPAFGPAGMQDHMRTLEDGSAVVEMLLEAYYLQVDQTAGKLEACGNSIHDTEAFVNIRLDQHRNYLISIDLIVSIGSLVLAACACVTGIFGMNLQSGMESKPHGMAEVSTYMLVAAGAVWGLVIWWVMSRGIIQNPWSRSG